MKKVIIVVFFVSLVLTQASFALDKKDVNELLDVLKSNAEKIESGDEGYFGSRSWSWGDHQLIYVGYTEYYNDFNFHVGEKSLLIHYGDIEIHDQGIIGTLMCKNQNSRRLVDCIWQLEQSCASTIYLNNEPICKDKLAKKNLAQKQNIYEKIITEILKAIKRRK